MGDLPEGVVPIRRPIAREDLEPQIRRSPEMAVILAMAAALTKPQRRSAASALFRLAMDHPQDGDARLAYDIFKGAF